jgi:hypothetical protein
MSNKIIETLFELKGLASEETGVDVFIRLNGGLRSSKTIWYNINTGLWSVSHDIDDTFDEDITDEELNELTNIVEAINLKALYLD